MSDKAEREKRAYSLRSAEQKRVAALERLFLAAFLEDARHHVMTDKERAAQRESWGRQMKD